MSILLVGDIHGEFGKLNTLITKKKPCLVLQCGDFGWWPGMSARDMCLQDDYSLQRIPPWRHDGIKSEVPVHWCDGNHEDHLSLETHQDKGDAIELYSNVIFQPRGSVLTLPDGRNVMFFGGATSIDRDMRTPGFDWFHHEVPTLPQLKRAMDYKGRIDIIVSHTAPVEFAIHGDFLCRVDDPTRSDLSHLLQKFQPSKWFFGHWHRDVHGNYGSTEWQCLSYPGSGRRWWSWLS